MTLGELEARDRRIAEIEAIPRHRRTAAEQDELGRLMIGRDAFWRRLPHAAAAARAKVSALESYAAQHRLAL